ncbi:MAG: hypothetical protein ACTS4X_00475 [Candidatus Hodgkinia cicadicola]
MCWSVSFNTPKKGCAPSHLTKCFNIKIENVPIVWSIDLPLNISLANQLCHLLQLHFIEFNTSVWTIDLSLIVIFTSVGYFLRWWLTFR